MWQRKKLLPSVCAAIAGTALVIACSSGSSSPPNNNPTPPGTTPMTMAPYAVCVALESGAFTASGTYAVPSTKSCSPAGMPATGDADMHCAGMPAQTVSGSSCNLQDAGAPASGDAGMPAGDAGAPPAPGPCDENGTDGAYGSTMNGTEGDDDDCKYHVSYTATPICENNGTYFVVNATYLSTGAALTGAATFAEICLSDTHPAPPVDSRPPSGRQQVVEGPPGTYTVGPVQFDAPGNWTVRFHFNEFCCDIADDSPHGHAAFLITVP